MRIIGHERRFQADPSADIRSRFYANTVDALDLVDVVEGDTHGLIRGEELSRVLWEHLRRGRRYRPGSAKVGIPTEWYRLRAA
jgi:hypothetical protein